MCFYKNSSLENLKCEFEGNYYEEEWRDIKEFEGIYQVSSFGRVKTLKRFQVYNSGLKRTYNDKIIKQLRGTSYLVVVLSNLNKNLKTIPTGVHRFVATAFHENPDNKPQVNHKDGNKYNNFYKNIEWATPSENSLHAFAQGLSKPTLGTINGMCILADDQVLEIFKSNKKQKELAKEYNVCQQTISSIKTGKNWSFLTGKQHTRAFVKQAK